MIKFIERKAKARTKELNEFRRGSWIYAEAPSDVEMDLLREKFNLDAGHLQDALDEDEMPRLEREGEHLYLFTRFPYQDSNSQLETATVLLVLSKEFLLSLSTKPLPRLESLMGDEITYETANTEQVMLLILSQIVEQYDTHLNQISRQIKSIRSRLKVESIANEDFIDFVLIEDELNEFLSALTPTNSILRRLMINQAVRFTVKDKELLEDLLLANEQSIEQAKSHAKSIINIREAYSTIMSNNLNRVIKILTVLTVILSVPTLVASLYGMNVKLPFDTHLHAFSYIFIGSTLVSLLLLWYFRHKDWL